MVNLGMPRSNLHESCKLGLSGALNLLQIRLKHSLVCSMAIFCTVNLSEFLIGVKTPMTETMPRFVSQRRTTKSHMVLLKGTGRRSRALKRCLIELHFNTGIYASRDFVRSVPKNVEIDIPSLIQLRLESKKKVGYRIT